MNTIEENIKNVRLPQRTESYTPISHRKIIETIENVCESNNLSIIDRKYNSSAKCEKVTGKFALNLNDSDIGSMIAFQNSLDKSLSVKFATGANVFICSNGMVLGEHTMKRKHTGNADEMLFNYIEEAVNATVNNFEKTLSIRDRMKEVSLNDNAVYELVGELFMTEEIMRINQLSHFKKEYVNPRFDYKVERNNLWNIYNICTDAIERHTHPNLYLGQNQKLTEKITSKFLS